MIEPPGAEGLHLNASVQCGHRDITPGKMEGCGVWMDGMLLGGGGGDGEKETGGSPGHLSVIIRGLMHREMTATMSTWLIWEEGRGLPWMGGGWGGWGVSRNKEGCGCEGEGRMVTKTLRVPLPEE